MAWVGAVVVVGRMASVALGWRPGKPCCMAIQTIGRLVCACERELGGVVVEHNISIARGMTGQTSIAVVRISAHTGVLVVGFRVGVARYARKFGVVGRIGVAIGAGCPLPVVFPAVNGEILGIVLEIGGRPSRFGVATRAIGRDFLRGVVGIGRLVVVGVVAAVAGIGGIVVVAIMALGTVVGNGRVCPIECIKIIVYWECGRFPTGDGGVALGAVGWQV